MINEVSSRIQPPAFSGSKRSLNPVAKPPQDSVSFSGGINAEKAGDAIKPIKKLFTETIPNLFREGGIVRTFFTETAKPFFTETIPNLFKKGGAVRTFVTETVPEFFGRILHKAGKVADDAAQTGADKV